MLPLARREKLTVREMPDETLVFDNRNNKAHCLNRTAAFIWKHCDSRTTLAQLALALHSGLGLPANESVVRLALEQLDRRQLLAQNVEPQEESRRRGRRDVLRKLALTAAALPIVMTLTAKKAHASGGVTCTPSQNSFCQTTCFMTCSGQGKTPTSGCTAGSCSCLCT
jgi:hypothetical protein